MYENSERLGDPILSIVVPVYNEEENVPVLVAALKATLEKLNLDHEVILVDDGSRDKTWEKIKEAACVSPPIKGLSLSRNFGHQHALLAGLNHARGRVIVSMDGDLQHPPEKIFEMINLWKDGFKIVNTHRIDSEDTSSFKRITSKYFYKIFSLFAGFDIAKGSSDFRLIDRQVLDAIKGMNDTDLFLRGIVAWIGFPVASIDYEAQKRFSGKTKYSLKKMFSFAISALLSFSTKPLKFGIWLGLATSLMAFIEICYILVSYFNGNTIQGWASILAFNSLMFGIMFILIGVIGAYLATVQESLKNRPRFLINESVGDKIKNL